MWEFRPPTNLRAFTASYRNSFTLPLSLLRMNDTMTFLSGTPCRLCQAEIVTKSGITQSEIWLDKRLKERGLSARKIEIFISLLLSEVRHSINTIGSNFSILAKQNIWIKFASREGNITDIIRECSCRTDAEGKFVLWIQFYAAR
jgi:hypothetical protein